MKNEVPTARLLAVSRDPEVLRVIWTTAEPNFWQLIVASSAGDAMEKLQSDLAVDVLLIDLSAEETDAFRCLRWLRQLRSALPILLIDRAREAGTKLQSIRIDSTYYLIAPLAAPQLEAGIVRSISSTRDGSAKDIAADDIGHPGDGLLFIGASPKMHRVTAQVALLAEADLPVVISGESGSGKETIARLLHQLSDRSTFPFAKVDCSKLCAELLEREIFGYEPSHGGESAGITCGKLELSAGGTLFLDEIEKMPSQLQSELAKVMESGLLIRAGSSQAVEINVRVVAASSRPIDCDICDGRMVPELSRQFGTSEVRVPPLRERKEELPLLARHYMQQLSKQLGIAPKEFSLATEEAWQSYHWPGNLRELRQSVKQVLIAGETSCEAKKTQPDQASEALPAMQIEVPGANLLVAPARHTVTDIGGYKSLRSMMRSVREEAERTAIASALEKTGWNRKAAARLLNVSYRSILYKIEQYQISAPDRAQSWRSGGFRPKESKPVTARAKAQWA